MDERKPLGRQHETGAPMVSGLTSLCSEKKIGIVMLANKNIHDARVKAAHLVCRDLPISPTSISGRHGPTSSRRVR